MKNLIIKTETTAEIEAVVSFLQIALNMQRDANAVIDFREPEQVAELHGFSVQEYIAAMNNLRMAIRIHKEAAK